MARTPLRGARMVLPLLFSVSLGSALAGDDDPITATPVSPGTPEVGALIGDPCPSFSWGAVEGAQRYELAIFDAQWDASPTYDEQQRQGAQLRQIAISAPALSWTPAGGDCLDAGGTYLWFVRAQTADGDGSWSAPRYFEIDYDADALTQTVRRELAAQLRQPEVWRDVIQSALSSNASLQLTSLAPGVVEPPSAASDKGSTGAGSGLPGSSAEPMATVLATTFPNPAALKINSPNGVVFNQSATGGGIPAAGAGTRFMWYPGKAALRAGYVDGTRWDDAYVGSHSVAFGYNTSGDGDFSMATGSDTIAYGNYSTAMGQDTLAQGDNSIAMGIGVEAKSNYSIALGANSIATHVGSIAIGVGVSAIGMESIAIGTATTANGSYSTAMGEATFANGKVSTAMGFGTIAESYGETVIGAYNTLTQNPDPDGWIGTDRLFVIGNGTADSTRSDALVVYKNGNLVIAANAAKPGGGSWANSSDARLKDISGPYGSGLEEIAALQPVRYHYAEGNARGHDPEPEYVGFIAQQAQAVFPEAVNEGADGYLDFNMHAVNVAMVNAIQTLLEQNLALGAQLQTQADQIQAQEVKFQVQIADLRADKAALAQRLVDQEQRLVSLEAENARHARLQADLAQLQAQMRVLQGQMAGETSHAQVALGR